MCIHSYFKIKSTSHAVRNTIPSNNGLGVEMIVIFQGYWIVLCLCWILVLFSSWCIWQIRASRHLEFVSWSSAHSSCCMYFCRFWLLYGSIVHYVDIADDFLLEISPRYKVNYTNLLFLQIQLNISLQTTAFYSLLPETAWHHCFHERRPTLT